MIDISFEPWPKIARLNREVQVTEKIDGTNSADLPTEPGSVIVNAVIRGERVPVAMLMDNSLWVTPGVVGGVLLHHPERITEWELGEVVEADR